MALLGILHAVGFILRSVMTCFAVALGLGIRYLVHSARMELSLEDSVCSP